MSLDCFGKIVPHSARNALEACIPYGSGARLFLSDVDPEDVAFICQFEELKKLGVTFRLTSEDGQSSATRLWVDAFKIAQQYDESARVAMVHGYVIAIKSTALGGFLWNLLNGPDFAFGAVALVDGPIETVYRVDKQRCWEHFLEIIPKPWDCHDNPLFVWSHLS
jgi:hypothetical protein